MNDPQEVLDVLTALQLAERVSWLSTVVSMLAVVLLVQSFLMGWLLVVVWKGAGRRERKAESGGERPSGQQITSPPPPGRR